MVLNVCFVVSIAVKCAGLEKVGCFSEYVVYLLTAVFICNPRQSRYCNILICLFKRGMLHIRVMTKKRGSRGQLLH